MKKATNNCQHSIMIQADDLLHHYVMLNTEHTVCDIHDILKVYYKVAHKHFVNNIFMLTCDHHLVTGSDTSLKLFFLSFVSQLSVQQLKEIADKDAHLKRKHKVLSKKIENLKAGTKILT